MIKNHHPNFDCMPRILEKVGKKILSWRNNPRAEIFLSKKDFKTSADEMANSLLSSELKSAFPEVKIISEEDAQHYDERPDSYWLIDPIDGTESWYYGFDGFVTQAAYMEKGIPVYGAIHAPVLKKTWTALIGNGAYLNGVKILNQKDSNKLIIIDNTPKPCEVVKKIQKKLPITGYIECGSLGLKSVLVADGSADIFVKDVVVRDWDLAPAAAILKEVGGYLVQLNGEEYLFKGPYLKKKGFIVARNKEIIDNIVNSIL